MKNSFLLCCKYLFCLPYTFFKKISSVFRPVSDQSYGRLIYNRLIFNHLIFNHLIFNRLIFNYLIFNYLILPHLIPNCLIVNWLIFKCQIHIGVTFDHLIYSLPAILRSKMYFKDTFVACPYHAPTTFPIFIQLKTEFKIRKLTHENDKNFIFGSSFLVHIFGSSLFWNLISLPLSLFFFAIL
jgi:hypothetical protein